MSDLQVLARTLPAGFCPATYQEMLNGFSNHQYVQVQADLSQLIVSATKPADTTLAWLQLDQFGRPVRVYWFAVGAWLSLHPQPPGFVMPWFAAVPDFTTFDGGDVNALSPISGPMWERITDSDIVARFPLATGTLASGLVVAQGDTGGEEKHVLTIPELPEHTHTADTGDTTGADEGGDFVTSGGPTAPHDPINLTINNTGDDVAHNNMPPYVGMCWLRRTARMFYAVS